MHLSARYCGVDPARARSSRSVPIAAFVTAHHESLRDVDRRLGVCVTQNDMERERADADRRLAAATAALTDSCASRKALAAAQAAQEAASAQLVALQGVVSTKVDRSDLLRLQVMMRRGVCEGEEMHPECATLLHRPSLRSSRRLRTSSRARWRACRACRLSWQRRGLRTTWASRRSRSSPRCCRRVPGLGLTRSRP